MRCIISAKEGDGCVSPSTSASTSVPSLMESSRVEIVETLGESLWWDEWPFVDGVEDVEAAFVDRSSEVAAVEAETEAWIGDRE